MDRLRRTKVRVGAVLLGAVALAGVAAAHGSARGSPPPPGARWVKSIGASGGVVWAVDRHGFVWLTMDDGRTWHVSLRETFKKRGPDLVAHLDQVQFVDQRHGWIGAALGDDADPTTYESHRWAIERTVDGGRTWRISGLPGCGCGGSDISFYDARHGYALASPPIWPGRPRLFWTSDGGASWRLVARPHLRRIGPITFVNRRDGILGTYPGVTGGLVPGGRGQRIPAVLYRTTDGGKTWSKERVPPPSFGFSPLPVSSFGHRLVVGRGIYRHLPKVFTSIDGGAHWTASAPRLPTKAVASDFTAGSSEMWAFVTPGRLYVTHDGGHGWNSIVPRGLPDVIYQPLIFSSSSVGWATVGRDREFYRTTDGGRHWSPVLLRLTKR